MSAVRRVKYRTKHGTISWMRVEKIGRSDSRRSNVSRRIPERVSDAVVAMMRDGVINFVYCIQAGGLVKIGTSRNPIKRMADILAHFPSGGRVIGVSPGGRELEMAAHRVLHDRRVFGEWFDVEPEHAASVIGPGFVLL